MDTMTTTQRRRELLERMITQQPERLARKMRAAGHTAAEAEDLAQETLVRALRALQEVHGPAEEALMCGWVDRIASNLLLNVRRSLARAPRTDSLPDTEEAHASQLSAQDDADLVMCRTSLQVLLDGLPDEQRAVFVARVLEERTTTQVAQELGIPEDLVRWRLRTARSRLRDQIKPVL
jgi:RNA polymerase sigma-70 factor (ECF subfamily)